jgi:hypothetical protein
MYRTVVSAYTYGGHTVALPTEFNLTVKLATPGNFNFADGILTWDEVEGVLNYSVWIYEGGKRYEFFFSFFAWYKTLRTGGWTPSATMGDWAAFSTAGNLSVLIKTLSHPQNVQDLGGGKYSYHQDGQGPDPDTYIFTATDGLITEMEATVYGGSGIVTYRTTVYTYAYGGQTVALPTEFILTVKLATPGNFNFADGILTWDEVEGVRYYTGNIYKGGTLMLHFSQIDSAELNFYEHALSRNWTLGTYQIKIWANQPTGNGEYRSDDAIFEFIY